MRLVQTDFRHDEAGRRRPGFSVQRLVPASPDVMVCVTLSTRIAERDSPFPLGTSLARLLAIWMSALGIGDCTNS